MIVHVFNSSIVSGPETLVLPALKNLKEKVAIVFLSETRLLQESKGPVAFAKSLGHDVYEVPVRGRWDRKAFRKLRTLLDELKPEIVHAHDVKASLYLLQAKKAKKGFTALIASTHHGASYRKGKIKFYEEIYVRLALPKFDIVLAVCKEDQKSIIKRGVPARLVKIHLNGTDRARIDAESRPDFQNRIRETWREKRPDLPDSNQTIFLGAVARLSSEKRHDRMLNVLHELRGKLMKDRNIVLLCFGIGPEADRLKTIAKTLGIEDSVFWMGYSKTISQEMAGLDLMLCLSDGEGIPINLLEAGWSGTPVLATSVGGIPDLMDETGCSLLVEKTDSDKKIAETLADALKRPDYLQSMGETYQKRIVSQFSEKAWLNQLQEVYRLARNIS